MILASMYVFIAHLGQVGGVTLFCLKKRLNYEVNRDKGKSSEYIPLYKDNESMIARTIEQG
jgi:hypothetical protein